MTVAVVIVNANGGEHLVRTLDCLGRQTVTPRRVFVVDNASVDGSMDGLEERFPWVEALRLDENLGFAAANNLAVRLADDCEWIALLNPDAYAEPRWLEELLAATIRRPEFSFFGSRLVRAGAPDELDGTGDVMHVSGMAWRRDHGLSVAGVERAEEEIFSPCAAAALYRRDVFLSVGGFDEHFFCYYEDSDLSFRLRLTGERCLYVPGAVAHHVGSATTGRMSDFTIYHSYRNQTWVYVKNMPLPLLIGYFWQHVLVGGLVFGAFLLRGQGLVVLRAKRDAVRGLPRVLRQRREIQRTRQLSSRDVRRVLAVGVDGYALTFAGRLRARKHPVAPLGYEEL